MQIAIDGPAGSGKSTIAKRLAERLNIEYIDTGAMYRAITLKLKNVEKEDYKKVLDKTNIDFKNNKIFLDGVDVSNFIRDPEISKLTSDISKLPEVREKLVIIQRNIAKNKSVVMEGRDISTVVLPEADYKFYLSAGEEIRAKRRTLQLLERGLATDYQKILEEIKDRDKNDINRKNSPLKVAENAVIIDSSKLNIDDTVSLMLSYIR